MTITPPADSISDEASIFFPQNYRDMDTAKCGCCSKKAVYKIALIVGTALALIGIIALISTVVPTTSWFGQTFGGATLFIASKLTCSPLTLSIFILGAGAAASGGGLSGLIREGSKAKRFGTLFQNDYLEANVASSGDAGQIGNLDKQSS